MYREMRGMRSSAGLELVGFAIVHDQLLSCSTPTLLNGELKIDTYWFIHDAASCNCGRFSMAIVLIPSG